MKRYICAIFALVFLLSLAGCGKDPAPAVTVSPSVPVTDPTAGTLSGDLPAGEAAQPEQLDFACSDADMFTDRDKDAAYSEKGSVLIQFSGSTVQASSNSVKINGTTVTLTEEATYILSGTLDDGMVIVNAGKKDKLQLVLAGVNIHSETSAALYIKECDKVFLTLAEGTENALSCGESFTPIDAVTIDGALFSRQDLTCNGRGKLTVSAPGGHAIVCKDDLIFTGGDYVLQSSGHGIKANDSVRITGATLTVDTGKDGIHAENNDDETLGFVYILDGSVNGETEGDGISAGAFLQIQSGSFDLLVGGGWENGEAHSSGGFGDFMGGGPGRPRSGTSSTANETNGSSMKGLKAGSGMLINGGTFRIDAADDALHSDTALNVNGGNFHINTGDDALHAEEKLTITGCELLIERSYEGLEAEHVAVKGGNIRLTATDDGINAAGGTDGSGEGGRDHMSRPGGMHGSGNGSIEISGGTLYINASGDGMDANGYLLISGGYTVVVGPTQGDTATLDYDSTATITGGTFIGTGAAGMAQTFSDSEQGVIAVSVGNQNAGTVISLKDSSGAELIRYAPELNFAVVILSTPEMVSGQNYTIHVGEASGTFAAN